MALSLPDRVLYLFAVYRISYVEVEERESGPECVLLALRQLSGIVDDLLQLPVGGRHVARLGGRALDPRLGPTALVQAAQVEVELDRLVLQQLHELRLPGAGRIEQEG